MQLHSDSGECTELGAVDLCRKSDYKPVCVWRRRHFHLGHDTRRSVRVTWLIRFIANQDWCFVQLGYAASRTCPAAPRRSVARAARWKVYRSSRELFVFIVTWLGIKTWPSLITVQLLSVATRKSNVTHGIALQYRCSPLCLFHSVL